MKRLVVAVAAALVLGLTPAALAAGTLSGKYKTKISGYPSSAQLNGSWVIGFTTGKYKVSYNGKTLGRGADSITGNTITFAKGGAGCKGTGKYKFKLSGKKLKFSRISDSCFGRKAVLSHTFTKV